MGMEEKHTCLERESDYVSLYSKEDFGSFSDGTDVIHYEHLESFDRDISNKETDSRILEKSSGSHEYGVKVCTIENLEPDVVESSKEKPILVKDFENGLKNKLADEHEPPKHKIRCIERPVKRFPKNFTKSVRSTCTAPQTFTLAAEKHASIGSATSNGLKSSPTKDSKLRKITSTVITRKPLRAELKKHPEKEDSSSVTSLTAVSTTSPKKKMLMSTPKFRCPERAEKRKEFNSKLEEKQLALEAEKAQYEARTKEETEAAIKQLRKKLTFKATPLPSFYLNGPLPNTELIKLPATQPKSPKLGRRKSCSDARTSFVDTKVKEACVQQHRASLGSYKGKIFESSNCYKKRGQATSIFKAEQITV